MGRLVANVNVGGDWFGPAFGTPEPPADIARQITNPGAWEGGQVPGEPDEDDRPEDEPPRSGRGSGEAAWRAYAEGLGLTVPADAGRDDIVALVDKSALPDD